MGENRTGTRSQNRRHPDSSFPRLPMADRIDPTPDGHEPFRFDPARYLPVGKPDLEQLGSRHHPVLSLGEVPDRPDDRRRVRSCHDANDLARHVKEQDPGSTNLIHNRHGIQTGIRTNQSNCRNLRIRMFLRLGPKLVQARAASIPLTRKSGSRGFLGPVGSARLLRSSLSALSSSLS